MKTLLLCITYLAVLIAVVVMLLTITQGDRIMNKDGDLRLRINSADLTTFKLKANEIGVPYQTLTRTFIEAFNQGNLRIIQSDEQKNLLGELYNVN